MNNLSSHRFHYGWIVLIMGTLAVFGALGLARFGYTTVLPSMQSDLGMDNGQAGLLATFNLAGYLALSIIGGALAARFGVRPVASLGLAVAGAGMVFTGLARSFFSVALWRGLTGIGSGAANVAVMGLWSAWFSSRRRGLASGIAVSGSSVALILTGIFVPQIIATMGESAWRICWFLFGSLTLLLAACSFLILRNRASDVGLGVIGEDNHPSTACPNTRGVNTAGVNTADTNTGGTDTGSSTDTGTGNSAAGKLQWKQVYLSHQVWRLGFVYTAFGFSYIIYMTFFVKFLESDCGYTAKAAGGLFMLMGWFSLLCGLAWGSVSDILGRKKTLLIQFLIHMIAFSLFAFGTSVYVFAISAVLFGLTAWSIPAIMAAACGDLLGPKLAPAALGFVTLFFGIGQAAGPVIAGAIADAKGSFPPAFLLAAGVALLGVIGTATIKEKKD